MLVLDGRSQSGLGQQEPDRRTLAAGEDEAVDRVDLVGRGYGMGIDVQPREGCAMQANVSLQGEDPDPETS